MKRIKAALRFLAFGCAAVHSVAGQPAGANSPRLIWTIGALDNSSDEFTGGSAESLTYRVSPGATPKDWRQKQAVGDEYAIRFPRPVPSAPGYVLQVDGFLLDPGPAELWIDVNGHTGSFRLRPVRGQDLDFREGIDSTYARVQVRAEIDAGFLQPGDNTVRISLVGDGGGTLNYDAVRLEGVPAIVPELNASVEPTIFFPRGSPLREVADIVIRHTASLPAGTVAYRSGAEEPVVCALPRQRAEFGETAVAIEVPAPEKPESYQLALDAGPLHRTFDGTFRPEKRWKLYAALRVHNDLGYTDLQENTRAGQEINTDQAVASLAAHSGHKFNLENAWLADDYLDARTQPSADKLLRFAREGRLGISAVYLNLLTGLCSGEELHRALYFAAKLHREQGVPWSASSTADVPSQSWSLSSVLAESGIDFFAMASNQHRGPLLINSELNEASPFWWEGPDGGRVLTFFSRGYGQMRKLAFDSAPLMSRAIGQFVARYRRAAYAPDALLVYGFAGDNAPVRDGGYAAITRWNAAYEYPKLIACTDRDYFDYVRQAFGPTLPIFRGDGGSYWADAAGTSTAATIENRAAQGLLPVAEMVAAWNSILNPAAAYPERDFTDAWKQVLFYDEHSWGAHNSITQPEKEFVRRQYEFKEAHAAKAKSAAQDLLTLSLKRLLMSLPGPRPALVVLNPGLEASSQPVETEIDDDRAIYSVRSGLRVPTEIISENQPANLGVANSAFFWYRTTLKRWRRVRFMAENVPGLGYATYEIRPAGAATATPVQAAAWEIESRFYRVSLDPKTGAIASIFDKTLGRELVDRQADSELNELTYVSGGEGQTIVNNLHLWSPAALEATGQVDARVVENVRSPLGQRIRIAARARNVPSIESEITVYNDLRRIDIENHIRKDAILAKEAIYFAFPFAVSPPHLRYQTANGWVRGDQDLLPGACREYFATQNLVVAEDNEVAIAFATPDLPLVTLTDIDRGLWAKHLDVRNGHVFSYVTNNYWDTNIRPSQGGDLRFRYRITSLPRDRGDAAIDQFDEETRTPFILFPLVGSVAPVPSGDRPLPRAEEQFLQCAAADARLTAFKQAEDGNGYILRVLETAGRSGNVHFESRVLRIKDAFLTNGVEEDGRSIPSTTGSFDLPLLPYHFSTVRIRFEEKP